MSKNLMTIGAKSFRSAEHAKRHIRSIIAKTGDGERLESKEDEAFVIELFKRHPNADKKFGSGIVSAFVGRPSVYRQTKCFYILRSDGSYTDISWTECIRATSHRDKVVRAMRALIKPQVIEFKREFFDSGGDTCSLTGQPVSWYDSHVDHIPPDTFDTLVAKFVAENYVNLAAVPLLDVGADNTYVDMIDDDDLVDRWTRFHQQCARLRVVSPIGNLSHSRAEQKAIAEDEK